MKTKLRIIIFAFTIFLSGFAIGQQLDSKGTDFWLAFPQNIDFGSGNEIFFSISGDVATTGMWEVPGLGISDTFSVTPGVVTNVPLPNSAQVTATDGIQNRGVHVTAGAEVTVYGVNMRDASTDAYLGLPTDILGMDYVALGYQGNVRASQMAVVGTDSNTTVTITPSFTYGGRVQGVSYNIILNQGDVYLVQPSGTTQDVSGTLVSADKKVAVFGGNQCVNVPTGYAACDHIIEQIPPINTLGKRFVALPISTKNGSTFRVCASEDTTVIIKDGSVVANLNAGEFYEVIDSTEVVFEATKPVLVAQYCHGQNWDGVISDPFMMLIPPYEQYLGSYTVSTPSSARLTDHYLNIIAPNAATATVLLNGVLIPAGEFSPIGSSGFSGVTKSVPLGSHTVSSSSPIGIHSYGFGSYDSYGYPGGQSLSEVASADSLSLSLATGIAPQGDTVCVVQATVLDSANMPLQGIRVDFDLKGANAQTGFAFTDSNGVATYCYYSANDGWDTVNAVTGGLNASGVVRILPCSLGLSSTQVNIFNGNPGSINLTVTGNVFAPTYSWTGPNGFMSALEDINVTDSGTYKVVVSDPFFPNCKDSLEVNITASTTPCGFGLSYTKVDIINGAPGSIDLTVSGAVGSPSFTWTGPNGFNSSSEDIVVTDSGTYKVVVTDPGVPNCADSIEVVIDAIAAGGNCDLTLMSDSSWQRSSVVTPTNLSGLWMGVNGVLPSVATFTEPAVVGQPYPWVHVTPVAGADPIKTGHSITYFRNTFNLTTTTGIEARFRMNVDDQAEIYVNGHFIARLAGMGRSNYRNPYHDAHFYGAGSVHNPFMGGDAYDATTATAMGSVFQVGANDVVVVVRNLGKIFDRGGFSFRMDLSGCGVVPPTPKSAEAGQQAAAPGLEVYPNPTAASFQVSLPEFDQSLSNQAYLYDLNGKVIRQREIGAGEFEMNISDLPAGVYYLKVSAGDTTYTEKVIKQ